MAEMKKDPRDSREGRGHPVTCAYCHQEIRGTPIEKNGYLYDSEEHARADAKHPPRT
ncbi:MAG TPA: hypothetical protein VH877_32525 [Polyangia bacterium]|jgi:hypothetical protein|nr:hypothetical protein [Polyangia bacterium]